ncbi:MAG: polyprenyl synthetase family protein [Nocardioidaceae bacterium]
MTISLPESLGSTRELLEPALRTAIERLDPDTRRIAAYHFGLSDGDGNEGSLVGKAVRATLVLQSAQAAGATPERGLPAAVAVELVHNFSLVHDDVMDGDEERRHRATAWTAFDTSTAILAGDAMLTLAVELLAEAEGSQAWALRCLSAATRRLIAGQAADLAFEQRDDVTMDECLAMARDKTAALLSCSASVGAVLCSGPPGLVLGLAEYGDHLGLAFQLVDDLLGIWGDPTTTGKPVGADLAARKKSLPVLAALTADHPAAGRLRQLYLGDEPLSEDEMLRAAELVEEAGGRAWAEAEASRQLDSGLTRLEGLDLPDDVHRELSHIARFTTGRNH